MDRKIVEKAFLEAISPMLPPAWADASFVTSEEDSQKTLPCLISTIDQAEPVAGNLKWLTVSLRYCIESRAEDADSGSENKHASRVKAVADILMFNGNALLASVNTKGAPNFECRGFAEGLPEFSIDGGDWRTEIRITAGIRWLI